ncbi:MAG TPA: hypothetical protein VGE07_29830 [Herpetosiphonaceae bacterium]
MSDFNEQPAGRLSQAADRERELADGVLDRPAGEQYNPEPDDIVAQQRARFDAANEQLKGIHDQLEQNVVPVMERLKAEADAAAQLPEHQAMVEHQLDHDDLDPKADYAGRERQVGMAEMYDDGLIPDLSDGKVDANDPNRPIIPVRNDSLRKDR